MGCKVYLTYENSRHAGVTGVYANKRLAEKERDEREDLQCIDSFELKGCKEEYWSCLIVDECKHYIPHLNTIRELISCLYQLEGCSTGGIAHVVVDDNNFKDHHLKFVIEECEKEPERTESGLVKLICEELLKLNISQRALLFASFYTYHICNEDCDNCPITKGDIAEIMDQVY